jgi:hypothetical protein
MNSLRERFDRNVKAKATIGFPFTVEDVAETLDVPSNELRSSWLTPHVNAGIIRNVGKQPSRSKKHQVIVWQGTYYLDLEDEDEPEVPEVHAA